MAIARFDSALARLLLNLSVTAVSDLRSDANPPASFCPRGPRSSPERGFDFMGYGIGYLARGTARPRQGSLPRSLHPPFRSGHRWPVVLSLVSALGSVVRPTFCNIEGPLSASAPSENKCVAANAEVSEIMSSLWSSLRFEIKILTARKRTIAKRLLVPACR
jgi:hypothetical protein